MGEERGELDKRFNDLLEVFMGCRTDEQGVPPERILAEPEGPGTLWRLSDMKACPECHGVRYGYAAEGYRSVLYCFACQCLEEPDGAGGPPRRGDICTLLSAVEVAPDSFAAKDGRDDD